MTSKCKRIPIEKANQSKQIGTKNIIINMSSLFVKTNLKPFFFFFFCTLQMSITLPFDLKTYKSEFNENISNWVNEGEIKRLDIELKSKHGVK